MEIEFFIPPDEESWREFHAQWQQTSMDWLTSIGLRKAPPFFHMSHPIPPISHGFNSLSLSL